MTMAGRSPAQVKWTSLIDALTVAMAISLPWSTSASGIIAVLWLLAAIPTLDLQLLKRIAATPAGGIPILLLAFGAAGMSWAHVSPVEQFGGFTSFCKLVFIPLLLHQFCRSDAARYVLIAFFASCILLMAASWLLLLWPGMPWPGTVKTLGVPVKDYIAQSSMAAFCILVTIKLVDNRLQQSRWLSAGVLIALALAFLGNVFYVATSRTALVVLPIALVVLGYRLSSWKGAGGLIVAFAVLIALALPSASFLRIRLASTVAELSSDRSGPEPPAARERLEYWRKSIGFIREAPVFGHGTGTIREQFRQAAVGQTGLAAEVTDNPHSQILGVGIQLGCAGIAVLLAMWGAHFSLFQSGSMAGWVGLVVVLQNFIGSLFNSHLFDFTHGWAYVLGVGVAGGTVMKERLDDGVART